MFQEYINKEKQEKRFRKWIRKEENINWRSDETKWDAAASYIEKEYKEVKLTLGFGFLGLGLEKWFLNGLFKFSPYNF